MHAVMEGERRGHRGGASVPLTFSSAVIGLSRSEVASSHDSKRK